MSNPDNVLILPVWKEGSSPEEWLYELAMLARRNPGRFQRMVLIYEEVSPDGKYSQNDYYSHGVSSTELMGLIEIGKMKAWGAISK